MTHIANTDLNEIEIERMEAIENVKDDFGTDDYASIVKFLEIVASIKYISIAKYNANVIMLNTLVLSNPAHYALAFKAHEDLFNLQKELEKEALAICSGKKAMTKIAEASRV